MDNIVWGEPIAVDGKRPGFLGCGSLPYAMQVRWHCRSEWQSWSWYGFNWQDIAEVRLAADHPHYRQTEAAVPGSLEAAAQAALKMEGYGAPTPQADTKPDLTARMEAFVQRVATEADYPCQMVDFRNEARAIVALLPEPVDPDEDEAMQLAAEIRCGGPSVKLALAAIKRGRALALAGKVGA